MVRTVGSRHSARATNRSLLRLPGSVVTLEWDTRRPSRSRAGRHKRSAESLSDACPERPDHLAQQGFFQSADERTRTSTWFPRHGPEPCASTNSATAACREKAKISHRPEAESIGHEGGHHVG